MIAIKEFVEDVDFSKFHGKSLILTSHFLEHTEQPRNILESLFQNVNDASIFHFAFPCFDCLLNDGRFDQIYNHHLQYFSEFSFDCLLNDIGFEKTNRSFIPEYWGTMITTFKKSKSNLILDSSPKPTKERVIFSYDWFERRMKRAKEAIKNLSDPIYGYGASLQISVLNYHLGNELSRLEYILDDDPNKKGLYPLNLDVQIVEAANMDLKNKNVVITAINFAKEIKSKLHPLQPRHILNPFGG